MLYNFHVPIYAYPQSVVTCDTLGTHVGPKMGHMSPQSGGWCVRRGGGCLPLWWMPPPRWTPDVRTSYCSPTFTRKYNHLI